MGSINKKYILPSLLALWYILSGCKANMSMSSGGGVPEEIKTFAVQIFENESGYGSATLSQKMTDRLKLYILSNTKLKLVNNLEDADWQYTGSITTFTTESTAASLDANGTNVAGSQNLKFGVQFTLYNKPQDKNDKHTVEIQRPYDVTLTQSDAEQQLLPQLLETLSQNIFQKSLPQDW